MGYFYNEHIKKFCEGKTIKEIEHIHDTNTDITYMHFTDGSMLRMHIELTRRGNKYKPKYSTKMLTTPYDEFGSIKQSTKIMEE